jgi:hypothetical protein
MSAAVAFVLQTAAAQSNASPPNKKKPLEQFFSRGYSPFDDSVPPGVIGNYTGTPITTEERHLKGPAKEV